MWEDRWRDFDRGGLLIGKPGFLRSLLADAWFYSVKGNTKVMYVSDIAQIPTDCSPMHGFLEG